MTTDDIRRKVEKKNRICLALEERPIWIAGRRVSDRKSIDEPKHDALGPMGKKAIPFTLMTVDESREPKKKPETPAERLLALAENSPELRLHLVERWARAEAWSRFEGIALAWTLNPNKLGTSTSRVPKEKALPEEAQHYLALAARSSNPEMFYNRVKPKTFMGWAHRNGLAFHSDWHRAVDQAETDARASAQSASDRRRAKLVSQWAKAPYWSPAEGVALAHDLDPKEAMVRPMSGYDRTSLRAPADALHRLKLAYRAVEVGKLDEEATPMAFMKWARSTGFDFHPDWWSAVSEGEAGVESHDEMVSDTEPLPELKTKEQESLLKMVVGMAMAGYRWDPNAKRGTAVMEIANDLQELGFSLDPDTIRKWLRKGADLIPREEP